MMDPNRFKSWLTEPPAKPPIGTWLMSGAPSTAEALGFCGFDFLVVDMEHVPIDLGETIAILRAIAGTPAEPLVRLAWNDQVLVKRVLDAGARSVMFPFIQTAEEARRAVSYTRYPPAGVRGVAAIHRGSRYGRAADYLKTAGDEIAVVAQLETPAAVERTAEIAAVDGVDALFLGPGDLSASMGHIGDIAHPDVQALIARAADLAHAAGKPIGIVGPNPDMVGRFLGYGYDWAAVASDLAMMTGRAAEWSAALRGATPAAAPTAAY
jgi:2-dehydro-3-deoxyglucarate aldolase/4-hydroxy-2-oxoheptanedioate aldolase